MTFVMYAPKEKGRNYLISDLEIEEEFCQEIENIYTLGNIYRILDSEDELRPDLEQKYWLSSDATSILTSPDVNPT